MDTKYFSTQQVAQMLNVKINRLQRAIWDGRIDPPAKSPGGKGVFLWTRGDIERASQLFRGRDTSDIFDSDTGKNLC